MPRSLTNTGGRGGRRTNSGPKKMSLEEKLDKDCRNIEVLDIPELDGNDIPKPRDFLSDEQEEGVILEAKEYYEETFEWLKQVRCSGKVSKQLVERYAMASARWIQCEKLVSLYGFVHKQPSTGKVLPSPYATLGLNYMNNAQRLWDEIFQIVKENSLKAYDELTPQDDMMERLLRARGK